MKCGVLGGVLVFAAIAASSFSAAVGVSALQVDSRKRFARMNPRRIHPLGFSRWYGPRV